MPALIWLVAAGLGGAYFGAQGDDALEGKMGANGFPSMVVIGLAAFGGYSVWQKLK